MDVYDKDSCNVLSFVSIMFVYDSLISYGNVARAVYARALRASCCQLSVAVAVVSEVTSTDSVVSNDSIHPLVQMFSLRNVSVAIVSAAAVQPTPPSAQRSDSSLCQNIYINKTIFIIRLLFMYHKII